MKSGIIEFSYTCYIYLLKFFPVFLSVLDLFLIVCLIYRVVDFNSLYAFSMCSLFLLVLSSFLRASIKNSYVNRIMYIGGGGERVKYMRDNFISDKVDCARKSGPASNLMVFRVASSKRHSNNIVSLFFYGVVWVSIFLCVYGDSDGLVFRLFSGLDIRGEIAEGLFYKAIALVFFIFLIALYGFIIIFVHNVFSKGLAEIEDIEGLIVVKIFSFMFPYLLVGILFSGYWALVGITSPQSIQGDIKNPMDAIYYSLVTLSSLGYGEITPTSWSTRLMAVLEVIFGAFYLAIVVGVSVGYGLGASKVSANKNSSP